MPAVPESVTRLGKGLHLTNTGGLVSVQDLAVAGRRGAIMDRVRQRLGPVTHVYFAEDVPVAYFSGQSHFTREELANLHRLVWNDDRVPLLVVIDDTFVRVFDAWAPPTLEPEDAEHSDRLITLVRLVDDVIKNVPFLHRQSLDTGAFASALPDRFNSSTRCDEMLLGNLSATRKGLIATGLDSDVANRLLLRSILLLHFEHRGILDIDFYDGFLAGASTLTDIYASHASTYRLFDVVARRLNGDILPVHQREGEVTQEHLELLRSFLRGTERLSTGQLALWPLYDFSVIPVQLVSAAYERLRRESEPQQAKDTGTYFTPHPLVEVLLNEVLPWPDGDAPRVKRLRILDPSCGSGVFLVEAFRRLAAHARFGRKRVLTSRELSKLLAESIFGFDENADAVSIAAFSLYLALLDEVPRTAIWQALKFPRLISDQSTRRNLSIGDAFDLGTERYGLVVGNPPWRRKGLPASVNQWCEERDYPVAGEIAQAFMWLAKELSPQGKAALVTPTKWLFNREALDVQFRRAFLKRGGVVSVINFAALVSGENRVFKSSSLPAAGVVLDATRISRDILYCAPHPHAHARGPLPLLIDAVDLHWIPLSEALSDSDVWKIFYSGSWRDLAFVRRLARNATSLEELAATKNWTVGRGFQSGVTKQFRRLREIPFVDADRLFPGILNPSHLPPVEEDTASRTGPPEIYEGPHVLIKEGVADGRLTATYVESSCSFKDTVTGVNAPRVDAIFLKALAAYLNSSLAAYLGYMQSGWGIDRRRIKRGEVLSLPATPLLDSRTVEELAALLDGESFRLGDRDFRQEEIDACVYQAIGASHSEIALVEDTLTYSVGFRKRGIKTDVAPPTHRNYREYVTAFASVFASTLRLGYVLKSTVHLGGPLTVASFRLVKGKSAAVVVVPFELDNAALLGRLDRAMLSKEGVNIYRRRHMRLFQKNAIHIIKPAESRFWSRSAAYTDADGVVAESAVTR